MIEVRLIDCLAGDKARPPCLETAVYIFAKNLAGLAQCALAFSRIGKHARGGGKQGTRSKKLPWIQTMKKDVEEVHAQLVIGGKLPQYLQAHR